MGQQILSKVYFYRDLVASLVHLHHKYLYWVCSGEICRTQRIAVVHRVFSKCEVLRYRQNRMNTATFILPSKGNTH